MLCEKCKFSEATDNCNGYDVCYSCLSEMMGWCKKLWIKIKAR